MLGVTFARWCPRAAQGTEVPREMVLPERPMGDMISRRPMNRCTGSFSFGLVQFSDQRLHPITEELEHFAEAAGAVKGGHVEIVALEVERGAYVVADHLQPWRSRP